MQTLETTHSADSDIQLIEQIVLLYCKILVFLSGLPQSKPYPESAPTSGPSKSHNSYAPENRSPCIL